MHVDVITRWTSCFIFWLTKYDTKMAARTWAIMTAVLPLPDRTSSMLRSDVPMYVLSICRV